jgi:SAM-dependent methyltransferase
MPTIYTDKKDLLPERHPDDFYETPIELCREVFSFFPVKLKISVPNKWTPAVRILDTGCGTGVWGRALAEVAGNLDALSLFGIDIENRFKDKDKYPYNEVVIADYFQHEFPFKFDLIVGNPPYKYAEEFVRASLSSLKDVGVLAFLLRTTFLNSQKRTLGLYKEYPPKTVYISGRRPSFSGDGKTNAEDYCVIVWVKGYSGKTRLKWFMWNYDE